MLAVVARYTTVGEAESSRSALVAAGIDSAVVDENVVSVDWLMSQAVGGVKLLVPEEHLEEAEEVLAASAREATSEDEQLEAVVLLPQAAGESFGAPPEPSDRIETPCPRCGSSEYYHVIWRRVRAASLLFSFGFLLIMPVWMLLPKWKCDSCGLRRWFR